MVSEGGIEAVPKKILFPVEQVAIILGSRAGTFFFFHFFFGRKILSIFFGGGGGKWQK